MPILSKTLLLNSLLVFGLSGACNEKQSFKGAAKVLNAKESESADKTTEVSVPIPTTKPKSNDVRVPGDIGSETTNVFKDCGASGTANFVAELYKLPIDTKALPDFSTMVPEREICINQIDITAREFTAGFPGIKDLFEWFALDINFNVNVVTAGEYKFKVNSDDGSKLSVDGTLVVDNDGLHPPKALDGKLSLTAGLHRMNLQYYQGPAKEIALELFWTPPGGTETYIPTNLVSRP